MANTQKRIIMPPLCLPPGCPPPCCPPQCFNPCCPPPGCPLQCYPPPGCPPPQCCPPPCCGPCCPPQCCPPPCCPSPPCCPKGPCCPPPPPCCPPGCCDPCKSKCGCCGGRSTIICVPKGCPPPCNPCCPPSCPPCCSPCCCCPSPCCNPSDPLSSDKPASFNNCNFYCSELPKGFPGSNSPQQCCPPDDCCCPPPPDCCSPPPDCCDGMHRAAGDDQLAPVPRRDRKPRSRARSRGSDRNFSRQGRNFSRSPTPRSYHSGSGSPYYERSRYGNAETEVGTGSSTAYNGSGYGKYRRMSSPSYVKSRSGARKPAPRQKGQGPARGKPGELKEMIEDFCKESSISERSSAVAPPQTKSAGQCTSPERKGMRSACVETRSSVEHSESMKWTDGASTPLNIEKKVAPTKVKEGARSRSKLKSRLPTNILGRYGDGTFTKKEEVKAIEQLVFPVRRGRSTARKHMQDYGQKHGSKSRDDSAKRRISKSDLRKRAIPHTEPRAGVGNLALENLPDIRPPKETPVSTLQLFGPTHPQTASSLMISAPLAVTPGGDTVEHAQSDSRLHTRLSSENRRARSCESEKRVEKSCNLLIRDNKIPPKTAAVCSMEKTVESIVQSGDHTIINKVTHQQFCVMTLQIEPPARKRVTPKNPEPLIVVPPVSEKEDENDFQPGNPINTNTLPKADRYINECNRNQDTIKHQALLRNPSPLYRFGGNTTTGLDSIPSTPNISPSWTSSPGPKYDQQDGNSSDCKFFPRYDYGVTGSPSPTQSSVKQYNFKQISHFNGPKEDSYENYHDSTSLTSTIPPRVDNNALPFPNPNRPGTYNLNEPRCNSTTSFRLASPHSMEQKIGGSIKHSTCGHTQNDPPDQRTNLYTPPISTHITTKPPKSARLKVPPPRPPPPMFPRLNKTPVLNTTLPANNSNYPETYPYPNESLTEPQTYDYDRLPKINTQPIINFASVPSSYQYSAETPGGNNSSNNKYLPPINSNYGPNPQTASNPYQNSVNNTNLYGNHFAVNSSSGNKSTTLPPISAPPPCNQWGNTVIKLLPYSDYCSPCTNAQPCQQSCPQPCIVCCRPVSRRCRRKRKCKRRLPRSANNCSCVCKYCGCVPCCCSRCDDPTFLQLPIRKVSCCSPKPCCRSRSSCYCDCTDCDNNCCCDSNC